MPSYKLIYFPGRGRAEPSRFVFAQAGVQYEDSRITGEEFGKMKSTFPAGALPVLEVDGKALAGSGVITRYLGETFGLAGATDWDNAQLASLVDVIADLHGCVVPVYWGKDDATKAEAKKKLLEESIPKYLGILENRIKANGSPDGWMYGNKITYVDLWLAVDIEGLMKIDENVLTSYPAIKKVYETVIAQPKIAEWIKNRPESNF